MFSDAEFQTAAKRDFEPVLHHYDGLKGAVIKWTLEHGNTNHDPSVLAWVLDPSGKVIAKCASASSLKTWMKSHARASFPLVDPAEYEALGSEAKAVASRRGLGRALAKLRGLAKGGDGLSETEQAEAQQLLGKVQGYAQWKVDRAKKLETEDPAAALAIYKELASQFKGDQVGDDAKQTYDRLRKDKAFQAEIKAAALLEKAQEVGKKFRPAKYRGTLDFDDADFRKKNAKELRLAATYLLTITKRYPTTRAATQAKALIAQWKLQ